MTELAKLYVAVSSALSLNMLQCMPLPQSRKALVLKKKYAVFIYVMLETLAVHENYSVASYLELGPGRNILHVTI